MDTGLEDNTNRMSVGLDGSSCGQTRNGMELENVCYCISCNKKIIYNFYFIFRSVKYFNNPLRQDIQYPLLPLAECLRGSGLRVLIQKMCVPSFSVLLSISIVPISNSITRRTQLIHNHRQQVIHWIHLSLQTSSDTFSKDTMYYRGSHSTRIRMTDYLACLFTYRS